MFSVTAQLLFFFSQNIMNIGRLRNCLHQLTKSLTFMIRFAGIPDSPLLSNMPPLLFFDLFPYFRIAEGLMPLHAIFLLVPSSSPEFTQRFLFLQLLFLIQLVYLCFFVFNLSIWHYFSASRYCYNANSKFIVYIHLWGCQLFSLQLKLPLEWKRKPLNR